MGWLSLSFWFVGSALYLKGILRGRVKPHAFSWLIWGLTTGIVSLAQHAGGAGPGAWATALTSPGAFLYAALALKSGDRNITRADWFAFICALGAIPLWRATGDPLSAVILISAIDALGFFPTFRKSWTKPGEEMPFTYALSGMKHALSLAAMDQFTWTTALYPASLTCTNLAFVAMNLWRRRRLACA
jgi:hypothetical protein